MDILLKNGKIINGNGSPWYRADLRIQGDRIARIGKIYGEAEEVVDIAGFYVCPGFIDMHCHSELRLLSEPLLKGRTIQGITTELLGQDGISIAPVTDETVGYVEKMVAGLLGKTEEKWNWRSLEDYFSILEKRKIGPNIAFLAPHGNIRAAVIGFNNRKASKCEIDKMKGILRDLLKAGAFGLSTGLVYVPCIFADKEELVELCKVVKEYQGIFAVHMRDEGYALVEALDEMLNIARETNVTLHISHFKAAYRENWGKVSHTLRMIDEARESGLDVTFDQYPYIAGSTLLDTLLPPWVREGGTEKIIDRLTDNKTREKIKKDIRESLYGWENTAKGCGWNNILITSVISPGNKKYEGKTLEQLASIQNKEPEDALFDLLVEEECAVSEAEFSMCEEDVRMIMKHSAQMVCSDGLYGGKPHPRVFGTFTRILGKYVREERVLILEDAIRKMTSMPAQRLGLRSRGIIQEGCFSDIVVFDAQKVIDKSTFSDPEQLSEGVIHVLINGEFIVKNGKHTGRIPGRILRA